MQHRARRDPILLPQTAVLFLGERRQNPARQRIAAALRVVLPQTTRGHGVRLVSFEAVLLAVQRVPERAGHRRAGRLGDPLPGALLVQSADEPVGLGGRVILLLGIVRFHLPRVDARARTRHGIVLVLVVRAVRATTLALSLPARVARLRARRASLGTAAPHRAPRAVMTTKRETRGASFSTASAEI